MRKLTEPKLDELLRHAEKDPEILAVMLFGSAARDESRPNSDIDICLVVDPGLNPSDKTIYSQKRLKFLEDFSFDIQIFLQLPIYIRKRILKEGRILYVRDEGKLYELAWRTAKEFEDFKHIYYGYLKEVESGGS